MIRIVPKNAEENFLGYIEYSPSEIPNNRPLVISLHGNGKEDGRDNPGETGSQSDLEAYLSSKSHLPHLLDTKVISPDCMIICPQVSRGFLENKPLINFRNYIANKYMTENIAFMGLSAGGASVWKARRDYPGLFKAFIPICGAYLQNDLQPPFKESKVPVFAHHGSKDTNISPKWTLWNCSWLTGGPFIITAQTGFDVSKIETIDRDHSFEYVSTWQNVNDEAMALSATADLVFNLYQNDGHGVWYRVYTRQETWDWISLKLLGEVPQPKRPLEQLTDGELSLLHGSVFVGSPLQDKTGKSDNEFNDLINDVEDEVQLRAADIVKKYNL